jgi:hypothetical protein
MASSDEPVETVTKPNFASVDNCWAFPPIEEIKKINKSSFFIKQK